MTGNTHWTIDMNDTLYDNWDYFNSNREIAEKLLNRSWVGIRQQAHSIGIKNDSNYLTSNKEIFKTARNYLDGLLLSDGSIPYDKIYPTNLYEQGCSFEQWLYIIKESLSEYNIECYIDNGRTIYNTFSPRGSVIYKLRTRRYIEFKKFGDRWYKKWYDIDNCPETLWHHDSESGEYFIWKKIVPKDIRLSPECVLNWYLGDGSITKRKNGYGYEMTISTENFTRENVIFLSDYLSEILDIKCSISKIGRIHIGSQLYIKEFLNYIKDCEIPECYKHKFPNELLN